MELDVTKPPLRKLDAALKILSSNVTAAVTSRTGLKSFTNKEYNEGLAAIVDRGMPETVTSFSITQTPLDPTKMNVINGTVLFLPPLLFRATLTFKTCPFPLDENVLIDELVEILTEPLDEEIQSEIKAEAWPMGQTPCETYSLYFRPRPNEMHIVVTRGFESLFTAGVHVLCSSVENVIEPQTGVLASVIQYILDNRTEGLDVVSMISRGTAFTNECVSELLAQGLTYKAKLTKQKELCILQKPSSWLEAMLQEREPVSRYRTVCIDGVEQYEHIINEYKIHEFIFNEMRNFSCYNYIFSFVSMAVVVVLSLLDISDLVGHRCHIVVSSNSGRYSVYVCICKLDIPAAVRQKQMRLVETRPKTVVPTTKESPPKQKAQRPMRGRPITQNASIQTENEKVNEVTIYIDDIVRKKVVAGRKQRNMIRENTDDVRAERRSPSGRTDDEIISVNLYSPHASPEEEEKSTTQPISFADSVFSKRLSELRNRMMPQ